MKRYTPLAWSAAAVASLATLYACSDEPTRSNAVPSPSRPVAAVVGGPVAGAIFTTTPNGAVVNANVQYTDKREVYLDGGPGPHAPQTAAGLTDGDYVFQVTDPSGGVLLSEDPATCRRVRVSGGIITQYLSLGTTYGGNKACDSQYAVDGVAGPDGKHDVNTDTDHGGNGAIVVQLMPFYDTPNNGGVYKAWMTPIDAYTAKGGDLSAVPQEQKYRGKKVGYQPDPGFGVPRAPAKTDNFKVKGVVIPPFITVAKFHDANMNGTQDAGEASITGWPISWTEPAPSSQTDAGFTPLTIAAALVGDWTVVEGQPSGIETVSRLDGTVVSQYPTANATVIVPVAGTSGETHAVVYGDVGVGSITACKIYDNTANDPIAGWRVSLQRTKDAAGNAVSEAADVRTTGSNGCYTWTDRLPGEYVVTEVMATGYAAVGATSYTVQLVSTLTGNGTNPVLGATLYLSGNVITSVTFRNRCFGTANFSTKGYWSNQNGVNEMVQADITYANGLDPYDSPTTYYGGEPFDGKLPGNVNAPAVQGNDGNVAAADAGAGTPKAEVSYYLVLSNSGGDPRQQLAQQLLAFIFNSRHRLSGPGDQIVGPDGTVYTAQGLITSAIGIWQSGTSTQQTTISGLLDWFNNHESATIQTVPTSACPVVYPPA